MVVGVNGTGKTTTIGKLAHDFKENGHSVMMVAADTFRAAAIEQLEVWSKRAEVPIVKQKMGADPSAVVFDAVKAAKAQKTNIMIIDTAGRLHTKVNLMEELKKMKRVMGRELPDSPDEVLLVLDATTGQNAISQAKMFQEEAGVTGIVLTKLDGTAKGGIVVRIAKELKIPIRYIGVGEGMDDLKPFNAEDFVNALF
jgi:fused signal recognition particle receptor